MTRPTEPNAGDGTVMAGAGQPASVALNYSSERSAPDRHLPAARPRGRLLLDQQEDSTIPVLAGAPQIEQARLDAALERLDAEWDALLSQASDVGQRRTRAMS